VAAIAIASVVTLPMVYLMIRAAGAGAGAWSQQVFSAQTLELLIATASLAAGVVVLSIVIALPYAWLVTRTDLPGRRFWAAAGALPLVFPSYIAASTLVAILGPRGEIANVLGRTLPEFAYGWRGAVAALGFFSYPYLYLLLVAAMKGLDPALEESARALGRSPWRVFTDVVLPQLRAPLAGGTLLIVLYTLSDFGAVSIVRYNTFTTAIYDAYRGLFDRTVAAMLATVLAALTLLFLAAEWSFVRRLPPTRVRVTRVAPRLRLGGWSVPSVLFVSAVATISLAVPLIAIASWLVRGVAEGGLSLDAGTIVGSLAVSAIAAVAAVILSLPAAVWSVRGRSTASTVVERLTFSGYALPGMVIALALVFFSIRLARPLYQTVTLLVIAYVVRFLPEAVAATRSSLSALSPVFEEAARTLGSSRIDVLRRVTLPMIGPGLLAGGGLVFLTAMKELPATLILRPSGFETLATRVWSESSLSSWSGAAMPALILLAVSAVPIWALVIRPIVRSDA
jgi:iron(III) transport system permease protein